MNIPISVEAHEVERLKTAFYRFLELRPGLAPRDEETPRIRVLGDTVFIIGAETADGAGLAGEFADYWRSRGRSFLERDPVTAWPRKRWTQARSAG